jgi:hypothetical protein
MSQRQLLVGGVEKTIVDQTTMVTNTSNYLQSAETVLGIGNTFTISWWERRNVSGANGWPWCIDNATAQNRIAWQYLLGTWMSLDFRAPNGDVSVSWIVKDLVTAGAACPWNHFAMSYGATVTQLWYNGDNITNVTAPHGGPGFPYIDKLQDTDPGPTDTSRNIAIGSSVDAVLGAQWAGSFYQWAAWDEVLSDAAVAQIYNSGNPRSVNLSVDLGDYSSSAGLQHWYRFDTPGDRGKDYGNASILKDLDAEAVPAGLSYVTNDYPGV